MAVLIIPVAAAAKSRSDAAFCPLIIALDMKSLP